MVIGIVLSLLLLTYIAYRGLSVILFAPVCALLAAVSAGLPLMPTYTELYMINAVTYIKNFFPVFLLGAVFGKVMEESGSAASVAGFISKTLGAERAIMAVVLAAAALTYGGVSLFVVAFAVYPFASALFLEANLPRRLIPGCIALGAFGFTMTAVPGSPQIQNMIPAKYFGTTAFAAPVFGILGGLLIAVLGIAWLEYRKRKMLADGEGYGELDTRHDAKADHGDIPSPFMAMLPLLLVLVLNYILTKIIGGWDNALMEGTASLPLASKTIPVANWALIIALVCGIALSIVLCAKQFKARGNLMIALNTGTIGSLLAIMNTASEVGYGNVIKGLPGFAIVRDFLSSINFGDNPLLSEALMVNVLAGITGSASGGMSIALEAMGKYYLEWANRIGMNPELLHRVAAMSSGGFDSLPHNGAVITLLAICGMTHKKSYPDIGMATVVIPFVVTIALIVVWTVFGFTFA